MASKDGGEVTERNDATIRTDIPNNDSTFKDLLSDSNILVLSCPYC